jgi:hypothetical protein
MSKIVIGKSILPIPDSEGQHRYGRDLKLDVDLLIPGRLLIQAGSGGGKSWALRRIEEALWKLKVQTIVIDPEGEFYTLREKFGYVLVGEHGETPADIRSAALLAEKFLQLKASAICDLYEAFRAHPMQQRQWVRAFLEALMDAPRSLWHPLVVIVDEAHKFCPQENPKAGSMTDREIIGGCKDAMVALCTAGRKRGFCAVWATQRLSKLDKDASAELHNRMVGMTIEDVDVDRAADLMSVSKADRPSFRNSLRTLTPGEFYCFGRAISTERTLVKVGPVETHHPETGKAAKNAVAPPTPSEVKAFLPQLADLPQQAEDKARTEAEFRREIRELKNKLAQVEKNAAKQSKPVQMAARVENMAQIRAALREAVKMMAKLSSLEVQVASVDRADVEAAVRAAVDRILGLTERAYTAKQKQVEQIRREAKPILDKLQQLLAGEVKAGTAAPAPADSLSAAPKPAPANAQFKMPAPIVVNGDFKMREIHMKIAGTLAGYYPEPVKRSILAALCGVVDGGSFGNRISECRQQGLIEDPAPGVLRATEKCAHEFAGVFQPPTTTAEVMALWRPKFGPTALAALDYLVEHPEPIHRSELASAIGTVDGGSFSNRLSELRVAGLLVDPAKGQVQANKAALFLDGEAA